MCHIVLLLCPRVPFMGFLGIKKLLWGSSQESQAGNNTGEEVPDSWVLPFDNWVVSHKHNHQQLEWSSKTKLLGIKMTLRMAESSSWRFVVSCWVRIQAPFKKKWPRHTGSFLWLPKSSYMSPKPDLLYRENWCLFHAFHRHLCGAIGKSFPRVNIRGYYRLYLPKSEHYCETLRFFMGFPNTSPKFMGKPRSCSYWIPGHF